MSYLTRMVALYSGQGMAHLIEYYESGNPKKPPDALALIDFGGEAKNAQEAVKYIVDKIAAQTKPTFNLVVVSHQDADHLSLLGELTKQIKQGGLKYGINKVYAGGAAWRQDNEDIVTAFVNGARSPKPTIRFGEPRRTDYPTKTGELEGWLLKKHDVAIRLLIAQARMTGQNLRNASSAVVVIENDNGSIVLPGDATHETMFEINKLFTIWRKNPKIPRLSEVGVMELPHHGALATATQITYRKKKKSLSYRRVEQFAKNMSAQGIFASAGPFNNHGHPIKELINRFADYVTLDAPWHYYVALRYSDKPRGTGKGKGGTYPWKRIRTQDWIYTTVTRVKPTVLTTRIEVDLDPSGVIAVRSHRTLAEILSDPALERDFEPDRPSIVYAPAPNREP